MCETFLGKECRPVKGLLRHSEDTSDSINMTTGEMATVPAGGHRAAGSGPFPRTATAGSLPPMNLHARHRPIVPLLLLALGLPLCLGGCPHRTPPAPADESWYRKDKLFDAFDAE